VLADPLRVVAHHEFLLISPVQHGLRLAARQVIGRHQIPVIRPAGAIYSLPWIARRRGR
jgi:hypothetical protein